MKVARNGIFIVIKLKKEEEKTCLLTGKLVLHGEAHSYMLHASHCRLSSELYL